MAMRLIAAALGNAVVMTVLFFALFPILAPVIYRVAKFVLEGLGSIF